MSDMQVKWYRKILEKDIDAVNGAGGKKESKTRLLNIVMQLRKCCNHPYLFEGAEPGPPYTTDEHLVENAAKMVMLDRLLKRLQSEGSRVLIFSQMSRMLDILEDYSVMRGFQYCRIDGSTAHEDRISAIDEYNKPGSEKFLFLLTTRAGGLGINLTSADIVILYDSDWNPQADLQAMDRAHRIGQLKQVKVYRFVTDNAIEEKVLERAAQKLRLDQVVIQQGRVQQQTKNTSKDELLSMIQHGAEKVFQAHAEGEAEDGNTDFDDIEAILKKGEERTAELNSKYENLGIDDLQNFKSDSAYEWNGQSFVPSKKQIAIAWIHPQKRERTQQSYSIDKFYRHMLHTGGRTAETRQRIPRAPKQMTIHDYQFFPEGLQELYEKETAFHRKENNLKAPLAEGTDDDLEARQAEQELLQEEIDNAVPLTEEEQELKERYAKQGFGDWNRRDFQQFINGSGKYGRTNYERITDEVDSKTPAQCKEYSKAFWKNYKQISNYEKYITIIEEGEDRIRKIVTQQKLLRKKLGMYRVPMQQMKLNYTVSTTNKKVYTEEEDRFILVMLDKYGIDTEGVHDKIRDEIRESALFRFDWFFLSRTPVELARRCTTLLNTVTKEFEGGDGKINGAANGKRKNAVHEEDEDDEWTTSRRRRGPRTASRFVLFGDCRLLLMDVEQEAGHHRQGRAGQQRVDVARVERVAGAQGQTQGQGQGDAGEVQAKGQVRQGQEVRG